MLLTEEEAKTKTCCQFRATRFDGDDVTLHRFFCTGAKCMAWRWGEKPRETTRLYHANPVLDGFQIVNLGKRDYPNGWQYEHTDTDTDGRLFDLLHRLAPDDAPKVGFCGLAGKAVS